MHTNSALHWLLRGPSPSLPKLVTEEALSIRGRLANGHHDFLSPNMFDRLDSFHPRRAILNALKKELPNFHGTLLDIGCGQMPYKPILLSSPSRISKYIGLELRDGQYARFGPFDLVWDGLHIPLEDNSIDCAIATEVFEQCEDPEIVMRETKRVLKAGGFLFFTVPFLWPIHDPPTDQYRFTPYALRNDSFETRGSPILNLRSLVDGTRALPKWSHFGYAADRCAPGVVSFSL
jgi:SAM-dependent methyltransferase